MKILWLISYRNYPLEKLETIIFILELFTNNATMLQI